jgi:hypothetical protein
VDPVRPARVLAAVALAVALVVVFVASGARARQVDARAYTGLGTWVDVYDYVPGFQSDGGPPPVTVASVDDMARLGVRTLYLQAAQDDARLTGPTVDRKLLGSFLRRAHDDGMSVVAWYLPKLSNLDADLRRISALHRFRAGGAGFDGIALDLEWTQGIPDVSTRNEALVRLSQRARKAVGGTALGAIVLEPLLLEDVNPNYWPGFPWHRIRRYYDVWLPMTYWTNRSQSSGLHDGFRYVSENVRRLRKRLGEPDAPVHAIGGVADAATTKDYVGFVRAARERGAIGWSVYDFNTTTSGVWARLRGG